jgi:hypothetical protein
LPAENRTDTGSCLAGGKELTPVLAELTPVLARTDTGSCLENRTDTGSCPWIKWDQVFASLRSILYPGQQKLPLLNPAELVDRGLITAELADAIGRLRRMRNGVVHGEKDIIHALSQKDIDEVKSVINEIEKVLEQVKAQA